MTDTTQNLEALMIMLCKTTAQNPMSDGQIASLKNITRDQANAMLDKLYEGKAISSVKNIKGGVEQRLVWVTGLPYRPALSIPKHVAWQHLRSESHQAQPIDDQQEPTMDDNQTPAAAELPATTCKELLMLRHLYAANGQPVRAKELIVAAQAGTVDSYIEWYIKHAFIGKTPKTPGNPITYYLVPNDYPTADKLYEFKKSIAYKNRSQKQPPAVDSLTGFIDDGRRYKPLEITQESPQPVAETVAEKTAAISNLNQQSYEAETSSVRQFIDYLIKPEPETHQEPQPIEFKLEQQQHIRFALTDEGTLMILGVHYAPIELSKEDTKRLYDFAENTIHAI